MADAKRRVASNVEGDFFVDSSCINCGVSRHYAAKTFGDDGAHAFVKAQPSSGADILAAQMALLACPVAAIGTTQKQDLSLAHSSFPFALADNVFVNGYNDRPRMGPTVTLSVGTMRTGWWTRPASPSTWRTT